jgi:glyoxylase-like metal-dependent hydrolase (beta-lactamase superfamily II)
MRLADDVAALELPFRSPIGEGKIYPTLIWDENTAIMMDTGFPGLLPAIREAAERDGVPFDRLDKVILTHQDIDHIGSLPDIIRESGRKIEVLASETEKPYIEGSQPLIKADPERWAKMLAAMPDEQRRQMEPVVARFSNPPKAPVDRTVADGEVLPYCGGLTVIHTPGHTPGHICLYLNRSKILVTGDALVADNGRLNGPNPQATFDMDLAVQSLQKLIAYDIETVVCYHGGVSRDNPNRRLAELAKGQ